MKPNISMSDVKHAQYVAAKIKGRAWWFGPEEARFFNSVIETKAIPGEDGRVYFVTSERYDETFPKLYSVRFWDPQNPVAVETVGKFQQYEDLEEAVMAACREAKSEWPVRGSKTRAWQYWLNKRIR